MHLPLAPVFRFHPSLRRAVTGVGSAALIAALTGCGMTGSTATTSIASAAGSGFTVAGKVHGGLQPVVGATIQLYEVGTAGYGTAAKPLLGTVLTGAGGFFSITGGYTCDPGSYVYITAAGGNAGVGTNNNIALMATLGSCSALKANAATTFTYLNEVTTVAAAYAMAQFSTGTAFGTTLAAQPGTATSLAADNFSTSATNVQGVANAMAISSVLANTTNGTTPGSNSNGTASVESYTINTVADILSTCINSAGGTSTATSCGKVFAAATPTGGTAPADTIQVALELALHPGDANLLAGTPSGSTLDALIVPQPPYIPYVNTTVAGNTINDWTIAVSYNPVTPNTTTTLLSASDAVAIDGFGNAWITNIGNKSVVELAPNGDPIQAGSTTGLYSVNSYSVSGTATNVVGGATATSSFYGIAIDNSNNAFASDYGGGYVFQIGKSGAAFGVNGEIATSNGGGGTAATSFFTGSASAHPVGLALDGNNNLFVTLYGNGGVAPTGATGAVCGAYTAGTKNIVTFPYTGSNYGALVYGSSGGSNQTFLAVDGSTTDTTAGTAIPGAPFVWWFGEASGGSETHGSVTGGHYEFLYQANTTATGANPQGCDTALGSITTSNTAASTPTTKINQMTSGSSTFDPFNNGYAVAFDSSNNLWTVNQLATDSGGTYNSNFTRLTPGYGAAVSPANFQAATTFINYNIGIPTSTYKPLALAIDGAGNAFAPNVGTNNKLVAVTNNGAALSPSTTGFTGATYSADGMTSEVARPISTAGGVAIDASGNLWVTSGAATSASAGPPAIASVPATNIIQIVGAAVPVQTPIAAAVKSKNVGLKP